MAAKAGRVWGNVPVGLQTISVHHKTRMEEYSIVGV